MKKGRHWDDFTVPKKEKDKNKKKWNFARKDLSLSKCAVKIWLGIKKEIDIFERKKTQ